MRFALTTAAITLCLALSGVAHAADTAADVTPEFHLTIKDQAFAPVELTVPANTKVKLIITNQDTTPAEFESYTLNREKVVAAGKDISVYVGPLTAGSYDYLNDFHRASTGKIIAK